MKQLRIIRGFTLIELLVVISIICVLASILFPVFSRARESARRAGCMSNEKQLGLGFMMYAQDYDGRLPVYYRYGSDPYRWWTDLVIPYIRNRQIFRCPSAPEADGYAQPPAAYGATYGGLHEPTYAFNGGTSVGLYVQTGRSLASIEQPSRTWMLVESAHPSLFESIGYGYAYIQFSNASTLPEDNTKFWGDAHLGGSNVVYADGHVKWRKTFARLDDKYWKRVTSQ